MKNLLVIWQLIPEDCKIFLLKDLSEDQFKRFLKCHNKIINVHDSEELDELNCYIGNCDKEGNDLEIKNNVDDVDCPILFDGNTAPKFSTNYILGNNIDGVIVSGFYL